VFSIDVGATHAYSLAARLSCASAERFRTEVIVRRNGVWEVQITATDVSDVLTRALLSALRDYLAHHELESAVLRLEGQEYVLAAQQGTR
jgi:hypothetical protein